MKPLKNILLPAIVAAGLAASPSVLAQKKKPAADAPAKPETVSADLIIYGGTPAGVTAAVSAADKGLSVVMVEPSNHIGGMMSGGLVDTDIGDRRTVGGLSHQFFEDIKDHYRTKYGADSQQYKVCKEGMMYEPHVAEGIFNRMLADKKVQVFKNFRLEMFERGADVKTDKDGNIVSFIVRNPKTGETKTFAGKIFIDAGYEGDLLSEAGVHSRIGREGREEYGEYLAGVAIGPDKGKADDRYQTFNFRVSLTNDPENRILFPKPENYYPPDWAYSKAELAIRKNATEFHELLVNGIERIGPNGKWDLNWGDIAGASIGYADGDWPTRERIAARYRDSFLSGLWYLQNEPSLPAEFRKNVKKYGLPKDEFVDNGHFPHQMYIRQARRMVGEYVLTEQDITQNRYKPDGIASGSYGIDCHPVRTVLVDGKRLPDMTPHYYVAAYDIPYRSMVPKSEPGQPGNLLVPVALSTSHVVYCSLRMEPVYMMLGQAAGNAAALAFKSGQPVQKVDVQALRDVLRKEGALLDNGYKPQVRIAWSPQNPNPGEKVTFTVIEDEVRTPLENVWWDFEGNGKVGATGKEAVTTFKDEKVHHVSLLVQDKDNRRRWVTADVPVGMAEKTDVTLDDSEAVRNGPWEGTYPRQTSGEPDVFVGAGVRRQSTPEGEGRKNQGYTYSAELPKSGHYEVSLAFRPAPDQAQAAVVKIKHADGEEEITLDQTKETTPFPFASLGKFRFEKGQPATITFTNPESKGKATADAVRWTWVSS